jgi:hypothetical protein
MSPIQCDLYCKHGANTACDLQITLCELWSRSYTRYLQLRIFMLEYSTDGICDNFGDIATIQCALYCNLGGKYSAHPPVYPMWTVVPAIYCIITAPHIHASIFDWTYLRCLCWYIDKSMCVILHTWYKVQRTSSRLCYLNCAPGHIQWTYSSTYSGFNIEQNVSALILEICRQFNAIYTANMVRNKAHILQFTLSEMWSRSYTL